MATRGKPATVALRVDKAEVDMLLQALHRAHTSYLETEIDQRQSNLYECQECGNTGPSKPGITHASWCWFRRFYDLRAKLLGLSARL